MKRQMRENITRSVLFITGLGIGAAASFLLDPFEGDYRRMRVRDQMRNVVQRTGSLINTQSQEIRSRAQEMITQATNREDMEDLTELQDESAGEGI